MADTLQKLGQYQLLEQLAQGGMAQVFKAKTVDSSGLERLVVIKRILPHISADPEYVEMLVDEAKIAVNFTHGNIAQVYDLGRVKEDYFIVMEYVDGKTLSHILKKLKHRGQNFPLDILLYCFIEVCHGLDYVHNRLGPDGNPLGVVHRDISPQNVILSYAGNIKIIDFGVAKARYKEGKTESGVLKGKFAYMSPEQARSDVIDHRSDLFSVGILIWEVATGERLFKRTTNHETVQAIQKAKFEPASSLRDGLPKELDKIIKKALQKSPRQRYQNGADMAADLEKLLFAINPDFKSIQAAEFIYKLFGPEEDEKELPSQIFKKEVTPITGSMRVPKVLSKSHDEEATLKEEIDFETPVRRIATGHSPKMQTLWIIVIIAVIFTSAASYSYYLNKMKHGYLILNGVESSMRVFIDDEEISPLPEKIKLFSKRNYRLKITKQDFKDHVQEIVLGPAEVKNLTVKLNSVSLSLGNIVLTTVPPGATVYLNNVEWKQKTPVTIENLKPQVKYKIGLYLPDYRFYTEEIEFAGHERKNLDVHLVKEEEGQLKE